MPTYVTLYKWTDQGLRNIKGAPTRIAESIKFAEAMGGKVVGVYVTMGEYDMVAVSEWPTDEAAVAMILAQASQGNVHTVSLKGFSTTEFAEVVKKMP